MTTKKTTTMFRLLAVLVCAALISTGCVAPDEPPAPDPTAAALEDARITALRGSLGDYDPALGTLDWTAAAVQHVEDEDVDVVVVPIAARGATRLMVARVDPGRAGPTFRTAVIDVETDPSSGAPSIVAVHDADGTARMAPGGGDFVTDCHGWCIASQCQACSFDSNPGACWLVCMTVSNTPCLVGCVVAWLVTWLWAF